MVADMRWTHLVTLMDAEAARQDEANDHPAAILLREASEHIRALHSCDAQAVRLGEPLTGAELEKLIKQWQIVSEKEKPFTHLARQQVGRPPPSS